MYTDETLMPFGKYKGRPLEEVPAQYLLWFKDDCNDKNLLEYIKDNEEVLNWEIKNKKSWM